ncbi:Glutamate--tRNA ligase mitochondrial [Exophiala xenobiotica]|nr:Glutamate--tRNA ligase mitochondrial [Exophiala xenobiotica]KAK5229723.1 Glutamate--tRNA ligase mitochondrial [Exophiala xenobiotica]KAK5286532.1 Glutamate--tRNA ligase mitochondrial [Exophiala xenobiotica]KAK5374956.1 Glutamate--tRNA ligase mitochondrial [Exophiala xenobiotica]KAK5397107.1 Glutamate--tRNA ligase mitochondrial [Exophiala xenobiotica]
MRSGRNAGLVRITGWICTSCRARTPQAAHNAQRSAATAIRSHSTVPLPRRGKLPDKPARTRFAPSPTGNLHLGSIRTALFNYLLARATKGQFLLRIEDTDAKRTIPGAEERLYEDLTWAGLQWDEGPLVGGPYGPYRQSERLPLYQRQISNLLQTRQAYRCFCSTERLDDLNRRRHDKGLSLGYDRKCLQLPHSEAEERAHRGDKHVIRFRSPDTWPRYNDLVYGKSGHGAEKTKRLLVDEPVYEDAILIKSDGYPTYHWANVCDDHDMHITHVVRGSEWMASTPLHVALYQSLGWTPPLYAHVPLLVDENKQKLSKRNFDSDIASFRNKGIFPESLVNFAALLGWSHSQKNDVLELPQLETLFDLKITKGNTIVSFNKLEYLQVRHARRRIQAKGPQFEQMVRDLAVAVLDRYGAQRVMDFLGPARKLQDVLTTMLNIESFKYRSPTDFAEQLAIFFEEPEPDSLPFTAHASDPDVDVSLMHYLRVAAATVCLVPGGSSWSEEVHSSQLKALEIPPDENVDAGAWKKALYHYLRWALAVGSKGPPVAATLDILGRETSVQRIQAANLRAQQLEVASTKPKIQASGFKGDVAGKRRIEKQWTGHSLPIVLSNIKRRPFRHGHAIKFIPYDLDRAFSAG